MLTLGLVPLMAAWRERAWKAREVFDWARALELGVLLGCPVLL
jgi:hypothetical protein